MGSWGDGSGSRDGCIGAMESYVTDVTDATFQRDVIEGSGLRPVVVDFWAEWCAPCRSLGPVLESLAAEKSGAFLLGKLDVDRNPEVAQGFQVRSIPAVKAFVDGQVVDEFTGALPEPQVRGWIESLLPTGADRLCAEAAEAEAAGRLDSAEDTYRRALEADPLHPGARLGLARTLASGGRYDEARELAAALMPDPEAARVMARVRVAGWGSGDEVGPLAEARSSAARGEWRDSLEAMLRLVPAGPEAREAMLDIFAVLGDEDPLTKEYRPKLASALF
jgi:putative thioredoxin